jgi:hypothetical protein
VIQKVYAAFDARRPLGGMKGANNILAASIYPERAVIGAFKAEGA